MGYSYSYFLGRGSDKDKLTLFAASNIKLVCLQGVLGGGGGEGGGDLIVFPASNSPGLLLVSPLGIPAICAVTGGGGGGGVC